MEDTRAFSLTRIRNVRQSQKGSVPGRQRPPALRPCAQEWNSKLHHRDDGDWDPREVDGEDASQFRQVARIDPAVVRFDAPSAEGEAQAQAGPIGSPLFERAE